MAALVLLLAPIGLLDSTSIIPLCIVPLITLLFVLGAVLVADGIGWFLGWPHIPV